MNSAFKQKVARRACIIAGESPAFDLLNDKTELGKLCQQEIDHVITVVLEKAQFDQTTRRVPLTSLPDDSNLSTGGGYQLPQNYTSLIGISTCCSCCCSDLDNARVDTDVEFAIENDRLYINKGCCTCCCGSNKEIIYGTSDINTSQLYGTIESAMSHLLAYYIAGRFIGVTKAKSIYSVYEQIMVKAVSVQSSNHRGSTKEERCMPNFYGTGKGRLY